MDFDDLVVSMRKVILSHAADQCIGRIDVLDFCRCRFDFLKDMPSENANYVFGIANLSTLSVDIFEKLYESGKSSRSIADGNSLYPQRPKRDDKKSKLSPVERFALVQKVGQTLGLIDTQGDFVLPEDENRRNKSLLYLMLDWDQ